MVCGLFSSFDPIVLSGNWSKWFMLFFSMVFFWKIFASSFGGGGLEKLIINSLMGGVSQSVSKPKKMLLMMVSLFIFFFTINVIGLIPFFFSYSSHLSLNLSISLPLWLGGMITLFYSSVLKGLSHVVPVGSPSFLWPLLVYVESVSLLIRPFTLAIRLMANMMAGHLILTLMGSFLSSKMGFFILSPLESGFIFFELCVSVVQSYVFMSLMMMYWDEVDSH